MYVHVHVHVLTCVTGVMGLQQIWLRAKPKIIHLQLLHSCCINYLIESHRLCAPLCLINLLDAP